MRHGDRVKAEMLEVGLQLWRTHSSLVTARAIGQRMGMTHTAVLYHWKTTGALKAAIAQHAVAVRDPVVVPMLIVERHPSVAGLTADERAAFLVL